MTGIQVKQPKTLKQITYEMISRLVDDFIGNIRTGGRPKTNTLPVVFYDTRLK